MSKIVQKWSGIDGQLRVGTKRRNRLVDGPPHIQQQNQSEQKVSDVKKRAILTLQHSNSPLIFWHFCLIFIVECLNHMAVKALSWTDILSTITTWHIM
jgi:hypothetical protein